MANTLSVLQLNQIAATAVDYLFTKSAMLDRIHIETVQNANIAEGVNQVQIPLPTAALTPSDMDNGANGMANVNDITVPSATINPFQFRKKILLKVSDIESRMSRGNMARAVELTMGGALDGLANIVDKAITGLYTGFTLQTTAAPTAYLDKTYISEAAALLENNNVPIDRCCAIMSVNNWWKGILNDATIVNAQNFGGSQPIQGGAIPGLYGLKEVDRSNNIIKTTVSGATTAHNLVFDKFAFAMATIQYEPAAKYGDPNNQETIFVYKGIPIRIQKWYDTATAQWYLRLDITFGVGILDASRFVHIPSKN